MGRLSQPKKGWVTILRMLKSQFLDIVFFLIILGVQLVYFRISPLFAQYSNEFNYLLLIELILFIGFLLFKALLSFMKYKQFKKDKKHFKIGNIVHAGYLDIAKELLKNIDDLNVNSIETAVEHEELLDIIFAYIHELKTPLTTLRLMSGNISKDMLNESLNRLEEDIEKLLYSTKLSDFNKDIFIQHYSSDQLVKKLVKTHKSKFIYSNIKLALETQDYQVYTDEKWFVFALSQMLTNALKYTPKNGSILLKTWELAGIKYISIKDSGSGIAPMYHHRIFDRGFSLDEKNIAHKGTGFGLYIAKKILSKLNWHISIESEIDQGTEFILQYSDQSDFFLT